MKKNRFVIILSSVIVMIALGAALSILFVALYYRENVNAEYDESLFQKEVGLSSTVFYANSAYGADEYVPVRINANCAEKKIYYELDEISEYLIDGFVAVEDRGFYNHSGVDVKRTALAAARYISGDKNTFGASTITQQLIKNISGDNEISVRRKITEILRAYNIEKNHTKSEILEVYLNVIPMGNGIYGVGAASEYYFSKAPSELNAAEAATLIGITNAPSAYDPYSNSNKCLEKRNRVLAIMQSEGVIDHNEFIESRNLPLGISGNRGSGIDSWFVETVISDVAKDYAEKNKISESMARILIFSGGHSIYTTVDTRVQNILEKTFSDTELLPREVANGLNYSMVILEAESGNILGIIGGAGKKDGNRVLNRATTPITPASTLKPIALYAPMIDSDEINWSSVFDDVPVEFLEAGESFIEYPRNSPDRYDGLTTVKDALRLSKNTIAVRLCKKRGLEKVFRTLREDYGIDTVVDSEKADDGSVVTDKSIAPMALGQLTRGVSLRKLTEAYTAFPNYGEKSKSRSYLYVTDKNGEIILENPSSLKRVFSTETGKIMNQLLSEVVNSGTASSVKLDGNIAVAGKTGTSGGNKDKIFIGYTPDIVAGIWCGYNNGESLGQTKSRHLDIWSKVMSEIEAECRFDQGKAFNTDGLIYAPYCMDSGKQYSQNCIYDPRGCRMEYGYFKASDISFLEKCDTHIIVNYDTSAKGVVLTPNLENDYAKVSLIKNEARSFPKEIYITDAEYVYRDVSPKNLNFSNIELPYFYGELKEGEYAGITSKKRQFNRLAAPE